MQFFPYCIVKCNCMLCRMNLNKTYAVVEFEDGIQLIPSSWLTIDLKKAFWPNFTNNKRYDKAVKLQEKPESTWLKHPILKIYGTFRKFYILIFYYVRTCACKHISEIYY